MDGAILFLICNLLDCNEAGGQNHIPPNLGARGVGDKAGKSVKKNRVENKPSELTIKIPLPKKLVIKSRKLKVKV